MERSAPRSRAGAEEAGRRPDSTGSPSVLLPGAGSGSGSGTTGRGRVPYHRHDGHHGPITTRRPAGGWSRRAHGRKVPT
jgi:hypothetical protein